MNRIRFYETEQLFKAWPLLEVIVESLKVDLLIARSKSRNKDPLASAEDYIEGLTYGNKSMSGIPPVGSISDSTGIIAANYCEIMRQDIRQYSIEWREFAMEVGEEFFVIVPVLDKLTIAYKSLTKQQQDILRYFYWENKYWKEVGKEIKAKSLSALKTERNKALDKMTVILSNSIEYSTYEKIVKMVDSNKEG